MLSRFNEKVQKSIALAESLAFDFGHNSVGTEHLLLALLKIKESKLRVILEEHHLTYEIFKEELLNLFGSKPTQPFYMEYTTAMKQLMENSLIAGKKREKKELV